MITLEQMQAFAPKTPEPQRFVDAINKVCTRFDISSKRRLCYFMTQASFETQGFTAFVEDLFYIKPERLVKVWPTRFSMTRDVKGKAYAPDYVRNPEKLANLVYANRNGNGEPESGDGWAFRGAGAFHLTGRGNYAAASDDLYSDDRLVQNPKLVQAPEAAMETAGWFWHANGLNALADADQFTKVTVEINNSDVTVPLRLAVLKRANTIFG